MNLPTARFISFILNPLLILVFLPFFLVFKTTGNVSTSIGWTIYTFLFLFLILVFMVYGVWRGIFTDLDASRRDQRTLLYIFSLCVGVVYIIGLFVFYAPIILKVMAIGMLMGVIIATFVNIWIKASIHTATLSGLLMGLFLGYGGYFVLLFILIPILGQSRISLKRHTLREIIVGWILGSLISLGIFTFLRIYIYK